MCRADNAKSASSIGPIVYNTAIANSMSGWKYVIWFNDYFDLDFGSLTRSLIHLATETIKRNGDFLDYTKQWFIGITKNNIAVPM